MEDLETNIKNLIKDNAIENLVEVIKNLSLDIDKYYIPRKEHKKRVEDLEKSKDFYIDYLDRVLKSWIDDDMRSLEEFHREFYSELHPELDVDKKVGSI